MVYYGTSRTNSVFCAPGDATRQRMLRDLARGQLDALERFLGNEVAAKSKRRELKSRKGDRR